MRREQNKGKRGQQGGAGEGEGGRGTRERRQAGGEDEGWGGREGNQEKGEGRRKMLAYFPLSFSLNGSTGGHSH